MPPCVARPAGYGLWLNSAIRHVRPRPSADALVTYAFEAAAGEGTDVTPLADGLLAQISA